MLDLFYVGLIVAFMVVAVLFVIGVNKIIGPFGDDNADRDDNDSESYLGPEHGKVAA